MSKPLPKAVFLSYAREDAAAGRRLEDARGGDACDQQIRRQIKECALFRPIVSSLNR